MKLNQIAQSLRNKGFEAKVVKNCVEVSLIREIYISEVRTALDLNVNLQFCKPHTNLVEIRL